jgi:hypothetical protein
MESRQMIDSMFFEIRSEEDRVSTESEHMLEEEEAIYREVHEAEDDVTSGYSTISESMEEACLVDRHLSNLDVYKQQLLE